ncbi:MAG: ComEA family DNA-binding protein [Actinomycetota bacterium]|nr:ComEA family DNA-binding protein [Actinomycetota bacterium]
MAVRPRRISMDSRSSAVERLERLSLHSDLGPATSLFDVPPPGGGWVPDDLPATEGPGWVPDDLPATEGPGTDDLGARDGVAGARDVLPEPASRRNRRPQHAAEGTQGRFWSLLSRLRLLPAEHEQQRLVLGALTGRAAVALVVVVFLAAAVTAAAVYLQRPRSNALPAVPVVESGAVPATATSEPEGSPGAGDGAAAGGSAESPVVVAVAGKVHRPGLVRLPAGARVDDAVRAAGGPLPGVDLGLLNLARVLTDGEQVVVGVAAPASGSSAPAGGTPAAGAAGSPVDLNTATLETLDGLPGVGPVLAQRIVEWRAANGPFTSVEQLRDVSGIGDKKFENLRSQVRV